MMISYKKKLVKNLGNYESLSLEIGLEDEVNYNVEDTEAAYLRLREKVNEYLQLELERLK